MGKSRKYQQAYVKKRFITDNGLLGDGANTTRATPASRTAADAKHIERRDENRRREQARIARQEGVGAERHAVLSDMAYGHESDGLRTDADSDAGESRRH